MTSKLSVFCDRIIEAGWLAAVVAAPLFFDGYTSTVMDPDKQAMVRTIAVIMAAGWLLKWIDRSRATDTQSAPTWRSPLVLPTLILVAVYILATVSSLDPRVSFIGEYGRPDGTYALLSYVVIFVLVLQGLRTRQQLDRLVFAMVLTSLPVALYGVIQRLQLDPVAWNGAGISENRVGSTLGNPIFMGAYLIMAFFFTVGRAADGWRAARNGPDNQAALCGRLHAAGYGAVAVVQLVGIVLCGSRGPWIGWMAGCFFFLLALGLLFRHKGVVLSAVGLGLAGAVFVVALNLPTSPLGALRAIPYLDLLGHGLDAASLSDRIWIWEGNARLISHQQPVQFPDGSTNRLDVLRPILGYGPDSVQLTHSQFALPDPFIYLTDRGIDHSHNQTWDLLLTTGLAGLFAFQLLLLCVFVTGLGWLGLMPNGRDRNTFVGLWLGLGLAGAAATIVLGRVEYLGLAIPIGNATALVSYLGLCAIRSDDEGRTDALASSDRILIAGVLAALLANYVEGQLGLAVPATHTLWWTFAGILVAVGAGRLQDDRGLALPSKPTPKLQRPALPAARGDVTSYALISALVLATCVLEFLSYDKNVTNPLAILWRAVSFNPVKNTTSYAVLVMLSIVWLFGLILTLPEIAFGTPHALEGWRGRLAKAAGTSLVVPTLFGLGLAWQLGALVQIAGTAARLDDVLTLVGETITITDYFSAVLVLIMVLTALAMIWESKAWPTAWTSGRMSAVALAPVLLAAWWAVAVLSLSPVHADVTYRLGKLFDDDAQWDTAVAVYQRSISIAPTADAYYMSLARVYQDKARIASSSSPALFNDKTQIGDILSLPGQRVAALNRLDLLYAAQAMLVRARDLNPLYVDHSHNLARFYVPDLPVDTPGKQKLAELANEYYAAAARLSPNDVALWNEWANFDMAYRNDPDTAMQKMTLSLARNSQYGPTYVSLGNVYALKHDYDHAIEAYQRALSLDPNLAEAESKIAFVYYEEGRIYDSIQAYLQYVALAPYAANLWEAHKDLALLYEGTGNLALALDEAQRAAKTAPASAGDEIGQIVTRLRVRLAPS